MLWLMIVLIASVCALLLATGGLALHIRRQHRKPRSGGGAYQASRREDSEMESEEAHEQ